MTLPKSIELIPTYEANSSWWQHVPIGHWLIEILKPETVVELGSHYGVSFFCFCEAAELYSPNTFIYAIDTWEGDSQAGYYDNEVYDKVSKHQSRFYRNRSALIREKSDDAANHYSDHSIDILHIDGLHTYNAVKNDYQTWFPKLKKGGSILFHDWNERHDDFGVWKLWEEIKQDPKFKCLETPNGHGLGIATYTDTMPSWHKDLKTILPALVSKGILLEIQTEQQKEIQRRREVLKINEQHNSNLESIINEQEKHIKGLEEARNTLRGELAEIAEEKERLNIIANKTIIQHNKEAFMRMMRNIKKAIYM